MAGETAHAGKSKPVAELLNLESQEEEMEEVSFSKLRFTGILAVDESVRQ
jgi:hypothetical protein